MAKTPEALNVGQSVVYEAVWFSGPNGTGTIMPDPGQDTFVSDNPDVSVADVAGQNQQVTVTGVTAGPADVTATSSNGVVAGFLDDSGAYQSGGLPFLVSAVLTIVSGILRKLAAPAG